MVRLIRAVGAWRARANPSPKLPSRTSLKPDKRNRQTCPGVLIPAPYYPAFDNDLAVRNSVRPLPVHLSPDTPLAAQLDAAADAAAARGHPVKALLVSNPSNPLGTVLAEGEVREMLAWCLRRRIHFVRCGCEAQTERGWGVPVC